MNHFQNLLCVTIVAVLAFFVFDWSNEVQAAQDEVDQFSCANVTEIPQSECEALVAIYNVFTVPPSNWLGATTPCSWSYLTCESGHITRFSLAYSYSNRLRSLPAEIGNLTNLTELTLSESSLSTLPVEIGNLTNLTELNLYNNQLSSLPAEIGNLTNLTELSISSNQLSSLPTEIGNLVNLTEFYISSNPWSNLPAEIGNFTNLATLNASASELSDLPAEIGNLTNLTSLNLSQNQLSDLPENFGDLTKLTSLDLSVNELLDLPAGFPQLVNLYDLNVSNNYLLNIGTDLRMFLNQKDPDWAATQFDANICNYASGISRNECDALVAIYNGFSSRPSDWLATNTPCSWSYITCEDGTITRFSLSYSYYSQLRSLPAEIGNLVNLTELNLESNGLRSLPSEIGNLANLTRLVLASNQLSSLPAEIGNLTNLNELYLYSNQLSHLPAEIGNLTNLDELSLHNNQLNSLPAEIGNLTNLDELSLYNNRLSILPAEIGNLTNLTELSLVSNRLSSLPTEISNLTNLRWISLGHNRLVIPDSLQAFITEHDSDWANTQTVTPTDVKAVVSNDGSSIELSWIPIFFSSGGGYYEISVSEGDTFEVHGTTVNKRSSRYVIEGLTSEKTYNVRVRTYTPSSYDYPNEQWSEYSAVNSADMSLVGGVNTPTSLDEDQEPSVNMLFLPLISN